MIGVVACVSCGDDSGGDSDITPVSDSGTPVVPDSGAAVPDAGTQACCELAAREVYVDPSNTIIEFISVAGRYYFWDGNTARQSNGSALSEETSYMAGPCNGKTNTDCTFETYAVFRDLSNRKIESITAYGRYYNWVDGVAASDNGNTLTSVDAYALGPCVGKTADACALDARAVSLENSKTVEVIIAYGKFYRWVDGTADGTNGTLLGGIPRYEYGPCSGHGSDCTFETLSVFLLPNANNPAGLQKVESVTAYGKYYNWYDNNVTDGVDNFEADVTNGSSIKSVERYATGPCVAATTCN